MNKICFVATIPLTIRSFFIPQIQYLADNDFDVTVICSDDNLIKNELGGNVRFYPCDLPRGVSFFGSLRAIIKLKNFFKKEQFDIIQYSTPNASFYAAVASKIAHCNIRNYHLMGYRYVCSKRPFRYILKMIEKITCKLSTSVECVSKSSLEIGIKENLFNRDKACVVWNGSSGGINLSKFDYDKREKWRSELRNEYNYKDDDFIFGFVGRITRDKGINELLEAFFLLNDDSKLFIIGNNENDGTINCDLWTKAISSSNVFIHDESTEIEKYYAMIDILVLPSYREGFGNVIIESGAMGTPAIVSDICGPNDCIIKNKTALVCKCKDSYDLLETFRYCRTIDITEMGYNARKFVCNNFDDKILVKKILERKRYLLMN